MDMKTLAIIITCFYAIAAVANFCKTCTATKWSDGFITLLSFVIQCVTIFLIWNF